MVLLASKYDESRFFRADDLKNEIRLKIKNVTEEKMADGEVKLTIWFTNSKRGLVLNRTNNRTIRAAFGDAVDGWSGKIIVLYPTNSAARWALPCGCVFRRRRRPTRQRRRLRSRRPSWSMKSSTTLTILISSTTTSRTFDEP